MKITVDSIEKVIVDWDKSTNENRTYLAFLIYCHVNNVPTKPTRYKCLICGRDKFTHKTPHKCRDGFRKHNFIWEEIYDQIDNDKISRDLSEKIAMNVWNKFVAEMQNKRTDYQFSFKNLVDNIFDCIR